MVVLFSRAGAGGIDSIDWTRDWLRVVGYPANLSRVQRRGRTRDRH